jgi:SAM-dependent methyltransferase
VIPRATLSTPHTLRRRCPSCGGPAGDVFYAVDGAPVHDVRLHFDRAEALASPTGAIRLVVCQACGFIWNAAFDLGLLDYGVSYESTQAFSPTFNRFHQALAEDLIRRFDLRGKTVLEIGCGQGEFLELLCRLGGNRGVGFDPAYEGPAERGELSFVKDTYSEAHADRSAEFVCCKMTLEHIPDTGKFLGTVRRAVGDRRDTVVFFQIPDVKRILAERAFWDIYFEHCCYFGAGSLARLFRASSFEVMDLWRGYDDQYLMIEARPDGGERASLPIEEPVADLLAEVAAFSSRVEDDKRRWRRWLDRTKAAGERVVLWGGGSKAVAFLTTLGVRDEIRFAVDVNPRKTGSFLAGCGQEVVEPAFLTLYRPDLVVVMNPIYRQEIAATLAKMGLAPAIVAVDEVDLLPGAPAAV